MTQEAMKLALEYIQAVPDDRYNAEHIDRDALITAIKEALAQPEQEPVKYSDYEPDGVHHNKFDTTPPQRPRVVFPTMLRKMWSGSEVQQWIDENVNKEKNT